MVSFSRSVAKSLEYLKSNYEEFKDCRHLSYLLTFKFSQDPLETLFSVIRASLGSNNNPTVIQFTAAFKKILLGAANRSRSYFSNCSEELTIKYWFKIK